MWAALPRWRPQTLDGDGRAPGRRCPVQLAKIPRVLSSSHLAGRRRRCPVLAFRPRAGARRAEEWLLIEWPKGEVEPTHYWLSTLPQDSTLKQLVATTQARWRIEHDYLELKSELGLDHFEGRGWRGFHHHASLCIAAYGFLILERLSGLGKKRRSIPRTSPTQRLPAARGSGR